MLAEMATQVVVAADPLAINESLRSGRHLMLGLEGVDRLARRQPAVIDIEALAAKQILGFQSVRADMLLHDHAIKRCTLSV